jgi:hypothetical protein
VKLPTATIHPVHFDDFSGLQFERLVFAYHVRAGWLDLAWLGQSGGDQGRDIIGAEEFDDAPRRRTVIQCVNRQSLTLAKARQDMEKAIKAPTGKPDAFKFVCGGSVSDKTRTAVAKVATSLGIAYVSIWSGAEFEEHLRLRGEYLLHRFVQGEAFPEAEVEIRQFVDDFPDLSDIEALSLMATVFDRPAFSTPFHEESSLPAFQKAIEDTIGAFNTGIWRTRDGTEIRRIPSVHHLKDPHTKKSMKQVVRHVDELRRIFVAHLRSGGIEHCKCGDEDCPVFFLQPGVAEELDTARRRALAIFRSIYPRFDVKLR